MKDKLRETLRRKQEELSQVSSSGDLPVQPQARRVGARKRLSERTGSVVARILKDLKLSPAGREVGGMYLERGDIPKAWVFYRMLG